MTNLIEIGKANLHDIPALLENFARELREGVHGDVVAGAATFLQDDGDVLGFGWGRTDDVHSVGLLSLGAVGLAANRVARP